MSRISPINLSEGRKKALSLALVGLVLLLTIQLLKPNVPKIEVADFTEVMASINQDVELSDALISVAFKYEGKPETLFEYNSHELIHPGSNYKLLTGAAVLSELGPDFIFNTELLQSEDSLILRGEGDPSLEREDLEELLTSIKETQKSPFKEIIYDDSWFSGDPYGPNWKKEWFDMHFAVPIAALQLYNNLLTIDAESIDGQWTYRTYPLSKIPEVINNLNFKEDFAELQKGIIATSSKDNTINLEGDWVSGQPFKSSVTVKDPAKTTAEVLKEILIENDLATQSTPLINISRASIDEATLIASHFSAPSSSLVAQMLTFSRNNYGESYVRSLGELKYDQKSNLGSQAKGVIVLKEFLEKAGLDESQMELFDGAGVSPDTRISAINILKLFDYVDAQDWAGIFWAALPSGGKEGTLLYRFEYLPFKGSVIAKSGTHEFSHSLSGKIVRKGKENILFSIHFSNLPYSSDESVGKVLPLIDMLVMSIGKSY